MDYVKKQAIFLIEKINLINKILKKEVNELNVPNKIKEATKEFNYIIQTLEYGTFIKTHRYEFTVKFYFE